MRISIRLYRNKDLDIMNFLYNPSKGRFETSLVRDILKDYTNGRFEPYPVSSIEDPNIFPESKLLSVTIKDKDEDIIGVLKSVHKGMGNVFIKCLIRKYSDITSLQIFRTGTLLVKYEPTILSKEQKTIITNKKDFINSASENLNSKTETEIVSEGIVSIDELEKNFNGDNEEDFWNDLNKMMQIF